MAEFLEKHSSRIALVLIGIFLLQGMLALDDLAPTWDEVGHLPAGYTYLRTGDFRLYATNPPLIKQLAALPLLFLDLKMPFDSPHWEAERHIEFGQAFLFYENGHIGVQKIFFLARMVILFLGGALAWLVFVWAREAFGWRAALLAVLFFAFNPNLLAHSTLVTTDIGFCFFFVLTLFLFHRYLKNGGWGRLTLFAAATGATLASKFTAVLLFPIFVVIWIGHSVVRRKPLLEYFPKIRRIHARWLRAAAAIIWIALIAFLVIFADYGFQAKPLVSGPDDRAKVEALVAKLGLDEDGSVAAAVRRAAGVVPIPARSYFTALAAFVGITPRVGEQAEQLRGKFLMGERRPKGFASFTVWAFLLKNPIPLLLFYFVGLAGLKKAPRDMLIFLFAPMAVFLLLTLKFHDFAYRYINLPLLPFVLMVAAVGAENLITAGRSFFKAGTTAIALWYVAAALVIHPNYLSYFNELIGGPRNGYRYMLSSNLDWGQDLIELARYLKQSGIDWVQLSYNGTAVPEYYGIRAVRLPAVDAEAFSPVRRTVDDCAPKSGWLAISATCLKNIQGVYPDCSYEWLEELEPAAVIGNTIFVYHLTPEQVRRVERRPQSE